MPYVKRTPGPKGEDITITIDGVSAYRLRALHKESQAGTFCGGRTSLERYCLEIIEGFLCDQRSNKLRLDPDRYWERNGSDADHAITD